MLEAIVPIRDGLRVRDLPEEFRVAFEHIEGATPAVRFRNGRFCKVVRYRMNALHWPSEVLVPLGEDDALVMEADGGVVGRVLGAL
jgi:hypothetical protein